MRLDWILNPLTMYILVALALTACGCLSLATKIEVCRLRKLAKQSEEALAKRIEELEFTATTAAAAPTNAAPPLRPFVNITKRAQALRMRRRGESVETITGALAVPRHEVELLLKLHEMLEGRKN